MKKFVSSNTTCTILKINRPQLSTLVAFGVIKPKRIYTTKFLYPYNEVLDLLVTKNSVIKDVKVCEK